MTKGADVADLGDFLGKRGEPGASGARDTLKAALWYEFVVVEIGFDCVVCVQLVDHHASRGYLGRIQRR